ncbi:MAG TPA: DnaJ domain-containing protein [Thermodesulfobacteriota bacterium]|nr:DnaJ domain-containing protein [Thermodesulfobacteriota bacterium]
MEQKDYYKILGVEESATQQQIKEAYRKMAFQYHPDRNKGKSSAAEMMKEINEAYSVLSNPQKRKQYENMRRQYGSSGYERFRQSYTEEDIFKDSDMYKIFDDVAKGFGFRGADEIFKDLYGSNFKTFEFRAPGFFGRGFFVFGPYGGKSGAWQRRGNSSHSGKAPVLEQSPFLAGILGKIAGYALKKITGIEIPEKGKDIHDVVYITPQQAKLGDEISYHYRNDGKSKDLAVKIPPRIKDGQKLRLRGLGTSGKGGGSPGDLYLKVKVHDSSLYGKVKNIFDVLGI